MKTNAKLKTGNSHLPQSPSAYQINDHNKRPRSEGPGSPNQEDAVLFDEKRSKIDDNAGLEVDDEDWLRPVQDRNSGNEEEIVEVVVVVEEEEEEEEKIVSRYVSEIDGDFIPVTAPSGGDRVYAKICRVDTEQGAKKLDFKSQSNGLISEPINVLLQKMEQEAFTKALQASSEDQIGEILPETQVMHEKLWVDKYAPNSFTELLSDEQTNREVLLWFKQWDSCVFGSDIRSTSDDILSALRRHSSITQHPKPSDSTFFSKNKGHAWSRGNFRHSNNLEQENSKPKGYQDKWTKKSRLTGPPEQKVSVILVIREDEDEFHYHAPPIFLWYVELRTVGAHVYRWWISPYVVYNCSDCQHAEFTGLPSYPFALWPPGLGKTTLAHVAAKHCGYRVVEINASDDRSSSTIETKILDVVQMNSVMADSRPKCLVIDEIDGALNDGKGVVEVLLKMVSSERKTDTGKENVTKGEQSGRVSSKKGQKTASLARPVICICNDIYAPALRPLRQVAKVHLFVQPTVSRVVSRLKYICNKEGIKTSSIALSALADYTECDIRSCLNTLQFLNKKRQVLNVLEISSQVVGRKDMSRSVFDIWKEIFQKRKMKQDRKSKGSCGSLSNEFDSLLSLVSNRGDYDVIFDGIYDNILQLHYHDPVMQKTVKCFNSLGVSDVIHQYIMRSQQMPLYAYQPCIALSVHRQVAQIQKPNIEWPRSYQRYRTVLMEKMDKLRSWQNKIPSHISRHLSTKSFVEDSVSPILLIISPPTLRPVAVHLLTEREKNDLAQLVSTMVSYSMTYKNIKPDPLACKQENEAALDASSLSVDPPIHEFINFKGYSSGHYALPLAVKQVLVHEVEKQKILQASRSVHLTHGHYKQNMYLAERESAMQSAQINHAAAFSGKSISNEKSMINSGQCVPSGSATSPIMDSSRRDLSNAKLKPSVNQKKPTRSSTSFFDRYEYLTNIQLSVSLSQCLQSSIISRS
ncbi:P-LOOP CONTAINING NUCLEOSIDE TRIPHOSPHATE HYDROLASES SUPERFAMILY PROTEIN [Salix purpurea]|uniref:Chromosome transmission fidelity protein 18 homolog n=1 Tax=Salix purpurea TaxID=77065 RepID=A0A9Q0YWX0_SALPP|nr:P-LOOP CONTAINING NUCLEOSIDE TRIPHOSPHATE HYDROLASES SUPERFAMILY PROTEIN [Salix purpurea]